MASATSTPIDTAAADPIRAALADPHVLTELLVHARAFLGDWLKDRPFTEREDEAETAIQETARCALEKRAQFDPAAGSASAWLHGFLVNVLKQTARTLRRRLAQSLADADSWRRLASILLPATEHSPGDELDAADILSRVSADQRRILDLRFREGLEHAEIASRLGISLVNARVRLCRALAAAKDIVGVTPGEDAR